jgi:hypothetical protein
MIRSNIKAAPKRSFRAFVHRLEEIGLLWEIKSRIQTYHVSLRDLYEGEGRSPSIREARKMIYTWLMKEKYKGNNEVARLFDRAPSGIGKLIR